MKPKAKITKQCSLCEIGRPAPDGCSVLCDKHGVMPLDSRCRSFRYDPLKREPLLLEKPKFEVSDFEI